MTTITALNGPNTVRGIQPASAGGVTHGPEPPPAASPAATPRISKAGDLMQKLQKLLEQSPSSFEGMMSKLADELKSAAAKANGQDASFLSKLSDGFAQAGTQGSLSPLQPRAPSSTPSANFGAYAQTSHRTNAGILRSFVSNAVTSVDVILTEKDKPPWPAAPVQ